MFLNVFHSYVEMVHFNIWYNINNNKKHLKTILQIYFWQIQYI